MIAVTALLLLFSVFTAPNNHDESQYVAGAALSRSGLIYRDFASLQPPLQSWAYAPLATWFPGWTLLAMRLATTLLGLLTVATTYGAQRVLGVDRRAAALATLAMSCSAAFLFTGSVVRNDMLPAALAAAGMMAALLAVVHDRAGFLAWAGLMLGAATSAKLSYAPVLACVAAAPLFYGRRAGLRPFAFFVAGGLAGLVPILAAAARAPDAFVYDVFTYARTAPFAWYLASGRAHELDGGMKLLFLLLNALQGPVLLAVVVTAAKAIRFRTALRAEHVILGAFLLGAGIGAILPTPTQIQYLLPLMPPLFVAFGLAIRRGFLDTRHRQALLGLFIVAGVAPMIVDAVAPRRRAQDVLAIERQAHRIGGLLHRHGARGAIATLTPERTIDSGYPIDPRFAAGPFLFRNGSMMAPDLVERLRAVTPQTLEAAFRGTPPAAILVGHEKPGRNGTPPADRPLESYALRHGFRPIPLADGIGRLYIRPAGAGPNGR